MVPKIFCIARDLWFRVERCEVELLKETVQSQNTIYNFAAANSCDLWHICERIWRNKKYPYCGLQDPKSWVYGSATIFDGVTPFFVTSHVYKRVITGNVSFRLQVHFIFGTHSCDLWWIWRNKKVSLWCFRSRKENVSFWEGSAFYIFGTNFLVSQTERLKVPHLGCWDEKKMCAIE